MMSELTDLLRKAKFAEAAAKLERLRIEEMIEKQFTKPDGGEGTHTDEEVKITWKINRKVDTARVQQVWDNLTKNAQKAFRWKAEVDLTHLRALKDLDPAAFIQAAEYITSTPAKPTIELLKD